MWMGHAGQKIVDHLGLQSMPEPETSPCARVKKDEAFVSAIIYMSFCDEFPGLHFLVFLTFCLEGCFDPVTWCCLRGIV